MFITFYNFYVYLIKYFFIVSNSSNQRALYLKNSNSIYLSQKLYSIFIHKFKKIILLLFSYISEKCIFYTLKIEIMQLDNSIHLNIIYFIILKLDKHYCSDVTVILEMILRCLYITYEKYYKFRFKLTSEYI